MANYATEANVEAQFGVNEAQLAGDQAGTSNAEEITAAWLKALTDATAEMDSYLSVRYDLPFTSTPPVVERVCGDIGMYRISFTSHTLTDEKRVRYEDALKWLKGVAAGEVDLGLEEVDQAVEASPELVADDRLFTRTTLQGLF